MSDIWYISFISLSIDTGLKIIIMKESCIDKYRTHLSIQLGEGGSANLSIYYTGREGGGGGGGERNLLNIGLYIKHI